MLSSFVIFDTKPLGVELSALAIRTAWACHEKGFDIKLVFSEEGVWCATKKDGYHAGMIQKLLDAEAAVYCRKKCLAMRGISEDDLIEGIEAADEEEITDMCLDADTVNYF